MIILNNIRDIKNMERLLLQEFDSFMDVLIILIPSPN